ncbi:MAG: hypothetical protein IJW67_00780 [Blautia sp.]|nr:hypothetical protein [Blautia sp.]
MTVPSCDKQIEYTLVDIKEDHPDDKTLRKLHKKSGQGGKCQLTQPVK